jgi:hypothetical protein
MSDPGTLKIFQFLPQDPLRIHFAPTPISVL